jgi:hypothetical protein
MNGKSDTAETLPGVGVRLRQGISLFYPKYRINSISEGDFENSLSYPAIFGRDCRGFFMKTPETGILPELSQQF